MAGLIALLPAGWLGSAGNGGGRTRGAGLPQQPGGLGPEVFKVVKLPERLGKDMDYQVVEIHQDPKTLLQTFHAQRFNSSLFQGFFQVLRQGQDVAPGSAGTDQKKIGKGTQPLHFQGDWVQALDRVNRLDRQF
jgi:hypothetical protein